MIGLSLHSNNLITVHKVLRKNDFVTKTPKGCLPQILLGQFLNTFYRISLMRKSQIKTELQLTFTLASQIEKHKIKERILQELSFQLIVLNF